MNLPSSSILSACNVKIVFNASSFTKPPLATISLALTSTLFKSSCALEFPLSKPKTWPRVKYVEIPTLGEFVVLMKEGGTDVELLYSPDMSG